MVLWSTFISATDSLARRVLASLESGHRAPNYISSTHENTPTTRKYSLKRLRETSAQDTSNQKRKIDLPQPSELPRIANPILWIPQSSKRNVSDSQFVANPPSPDAIHNIPLPSSKPLLVSNNSRPPPPLAFNRIASFQSTLDRESYENDRLNQETGGESRSSKDQATRTEVLQEIAEQEETQQAPDKVPETIQQPISTIFSFGSSPAVQLPEPNKPNTTIFTSFDNPPASKAELPNFGFFSSKPAQTPIQDEKKNTPADTTTPWAPGSSSSWTAFTFPSKPSDKDTTTTTTPAPTVSLPTFLADKPSTPVTQPNPFGNPFSIPVPETKKADSTNIFGAFTKPQETTQPNPFTFTNPTPPANTISFTNQTTSETPKPITSSNLFPFQPTTFQPPENKETPSPAPSSTAPLFAAPSFTANPFSQTTPTVSTEDDGDDNPETGGPEISGVPLFAEVATTTGEEGEKLIFSCKGRMYYFKDGQWKDRGTGESKILENIESKKRRFIMRTSTGKLLANHFLGPKLTPQHGKQKAWRWTAVGDVSDGQPNNFQFLFKLDKPLDSVEFKNHFESVGNETPETPSAVLPAPTTTSEAPTEATKADPKIEVPLPVAQAETKPAFVFSLPSSSSSSSSSSGSLFGTPSSSSFNTSLSSSSFSGFNSASSTFSSNSFSNTSSGFSFNTSSSFTFATLPKAKAKSPPPVETVSSSSKATWSFLSTPAFQDDPPLPKKEEPKNNEQDDTGFNLVTDEDHTPSHSSSLSIGSSSPSPDHDDIVVNSPEPTLHDDFSRAPQHHKSPPRSPVETKKPTTGFSFDTSSATKWSTPASSSSIFTASSSTSLTSSGSGFSFTTMSSLASSSSSSVSSTSNIFGWGGPPEFTKRSLTDDKVADNKDTTSTPSSSAPFTFNSSSSFTFSSTPASSSSASFSTSVSSSSSSAEPFNPFPFTNISSTTSTIFSPSTSSQSNEATVPQPKSSSSSTFAFFSNTSSTFNTTPSSSSSSASLSFGSSSSSLFPLPTPSSSSSSAATSRPFLGFAFANKDSEDPVVPAPAESPTTPLPAVDLTNNTLKGDQTKPEEVKSGFSFSFGTPSSAQSSSSSASTPSFGFNTSFSNPISFTETTSEPTTAKSSPPPINSLFTFTPSSTPFGTPSSSSSSSSSSSFAGGFSWGKAGAAFAASSAFSASSSTTLSSSNTLNETANQTKSDDTPDTTTAASTTASTIFPPPGTTAPTTFTLTNSQFGSLPVLFPVGTGASFIPSTPNESNTTEDDDNETLEEDTGEPITGDPKFAEVETKTGEESDTVVWTCKGNLLWFTKEKWTERGKGEFKLLKGPSGRTRFVMRNDLGKVLANHMTGASLQNHPNRSNAWIWTAVGDISNGTGSEVIQFSLKLPNQDDAKTFKRHFES